MQKKLICAVFILIACGLATTLQAEERAVEAGQQEAHGSSGLDFLSKKDKPRMAPPYRPYFYNYPHAIPPDYAFRTGRVFSPTNMKEKGAAMATNPAAMAADGSASQGAALAKQVRALGKQLLATPIEDVKDEYAVTISTFVNLNNLYATSGFGRYLSEQLVTELQQQGLEVVEVRKTPGIMMSKGNGEYGLSRDMDELSFAQDAQAMVVGTYAVAEGEIMINARLLRNGDNMVLSSASLVLPVTNLTAKLLSDEGMPVGNGTTVSLQGFNEEKLMQ